MLTLPEKCLRKRPDCEPQGQIESDCELSFVCCGFIPKVEDRTIPQDKFRVCWKNPKVDEAGDYDMRDLVHTVNVIMQAVTVYENIKANRRQEAPEQPEGINE